MKRAFTLLSSLGLCASVVSLSAADWPQFRGPTGQGVSPDKGVPTRWSSTENVAWKTELPGPGSSTPCVIGDHVFVTCYSGYNVPGQRGTQENLKRHLLRLNRADGKIAWTKDIPAKLPEQDRIREEHGYASSTPAADADRVYCFFGKSGVFAFDHDGKQLWQVDVGSNLNSWGSAASPILYGDLVIVNAMVESESLVALDKKTGQEKWRARGVRESWNAPILVPVAGGKTELVLAMAGKVVGYDPATGEQLWSCANDIGWYIVPGLVAHDGLVWCIGGRSGVAAAALKAGGKGDVTKTHRLWTGNKGSNVSSPIIHEGHLYWMDDDTGLAYCAEAKTGKIVYEERVPRADQIYSAAVLAEGRLYYLSRSGQMYVVAAKPEFELIATNSVEERGTFNSSPAVAGSQIFLRSNKFLYCIGSGGK